MVFGDTILISSVQRSNRKEGRMGKYELRKRRSVIPGCTLDIPCDNGVSSLMLSADLSVVRWLPTCLFLVAGLTAGFSIVLPAEGSAMKVKVPKIPWSSLDGNP